MKASILQLKEDMTDAKRRQDEAAKDIKRIELDMREFHKNKDHKLAELQVRCPRDSVKVSMQIILGRRLSIH